MLYFKITDAVAAMGVSRASVSRRLQNCPRTGTRSQTFSTHEALIRLPAKRRGDGAALVRRSRDDGVFCCGGDEALPSARLLEKWLIADPDMETRLHRARVTFFYALAASMRSASYIADAERHRMMLPINGQILPYIVTGDESRLPADWGTFAREFAIVHNSAPYGHELLGHELLGRVAA